MTATLTASGVSPDVADDTGTIDIVLVDDHAILRQGLRAILEREDDFAVVAEASTPAEAMTTVAHHQPGVVLLDLKLSTSSDTEGLDLCAEITARLDGVIEQRNQRLATFQ